jgi:hypothetical protein
MAQVVNRATWRAYTTCTQPRHAEPILLYTLTFIFLLSPIWFILFHLFYREEEERTTCHSNQTGETKSAKTKKQNEINGKKNQESTQTVYWRDVSTLLGRSYGVILSSRTFSSVKKKTKKKSWWRLPLFHVFSHSLLLSVRIHLKSQATQ